jgi:quinol-cytochrome oxidoreductase complex cytochrome b subunit
LFDSESVAGKRAPMATWFGFLVVTGMLGLTIWGYAAL